MPFAKPMFVTHNRQYEKEALSADLTYKPSADKDVRSCWRENVRLKICGSVEVPFLTAHHRICGNWNMTPGDLEKVRKHPLHLFPVSCGGASSSRTQMHLRQLEQTWRERSLCRCLVSPHTEQLLQWLSPELRGILLQVVALGAEWSCLGPFIFTCWVFVL